MSGGGKCVSDLHDYYVGLHHLQLPTFQVSGVLQSVFLEGFVYF